MNFERRGLNLSDKRGKGVTVLQCNVLIIFLVDYADADDKIKQIRIILLMSLIDLNYDVCFRLPTNKSRWELINFFPSCPVRILK